MCCAKSHGQPHRSKHLSTKPINKTAPTHYPPSALAFACMPETPAANVPGTSSSPISAISTTAEITATFTGSSSPPPEYTSHRVTTDIEVGADQATASSTEQQTLLTQPALNGASTANGISTSHSARYRPTSIMDNLFRFSLPSLPSSQAIRTAGVYVSGALVYIFKLFLNFFLLFVQLKRICILTDLLEKVLPRILVLHRCICL